MKFELPCGRTVLVDDADWPIVSKFKWHAIKGNRTFYAQSYLQGSGRRQQKCISLHRLLVGELAKGLHVDHINGDGLDNRRANPRSATAVQNAGNRRPDISSARRFKGVVFKREVFRTKPYLAKIHHAGKTYKLGYFASEEEAGAAYAAKEKELRGEFAWTAQNA